MRECPKCHNDHPLSKYQNGNGWCRGCRTALMKATRLAAGVPVKKLSNITDEGKLCGRCDVRKPLDQFSPTVRGLGGVGAYCKPCHAEKYRDKKKAVAATARYRKANRAKHLASHRVRMFERRHKIKVTDDGTATVEFLKALYETVECFYCEQETPKDERTAEHRIPLSNGGIHSASNLAMTCWTCNCSKRDLSEEDFLEKMKHGLSSKSSGGFHFKRSEADHVPVEILASHS